MSSRYSSANLYSQIFNRLLDLIPDLQCIDDVGLSEVDGTWPLHFDVVSRSSTKLIIMLGHSRAEGGGVVINPEMTVAVYLDRGMAEALTYRDAYMSNSVYSPDRSHRHSGKACAERLPAYMARQSDRGRSLNQGDGRP